jgi:glycosyltransferase involved in cell wall biosynthesis
MDGMKILIWHFRSAPADASKLGANDDPNDSAGTDGVSLEMMKRRNMLESMGHTVAISSAYDWSEYPIAELEFDTPEVMTLMNNLFGSGIVDYADESELNAAFDASVTQLTTAYRQVIDDFAPDMVFVHNILCLPIHPAATVALANVLQSSRIPCVAIHHDILSEGAYKFTPTCKLAEKLLETAFPPQFETLAHWTINTRNQTALAARGIDAAVIHDTIEFDDVLDDADRQRIRESLRTKFGVRPQDVVLLVGARIVPNKQIELAARVVAEFNSQRSRLEGRSLPGGATFTPDSKIYLILAGRPERAFDGYRDNLYQLFDEAEIDWAYAGDLVRPIRNEQQELYALFPDVYAMADMVVYPTGWEGFGNQLIEAFAAGLPSIVFEYPVYKEDIGPKGFEIVSLGDELLQEHDDREFVRLSAEIVAKAAGEALELLANPEAYDRVTKLNAELGGRHFGPHVLRDHLASSLAWAAAALKDGE